MKYTNECSFSGFWRSIKNGVGLAFLFSAVILCLGFLTCLDIDQDNQERYEFYLALKGEGENISSQEAIQVAGFVKAVYLEQAQNASVLNRMVYGNDTRDLTVFAFNHWVEATEYIENPDKEVSKEDIWPGFLKIYFIVSFVIFALGAAFDYIDDGNRDWWKYPWKRWWAYPFIPLMLIIILIQPFVLLYYIKRQIDGSDKKENQRQREEIDARVEHNKAWLERQTNSVIHQVEQSRENWAKIFIDALKGQKDGFKSEIKAMRTQLVNLGSQIEAKQKDLAIAEQDLKDLETAIKTKSSRNIEEYKGEFDRILALSNVKAVEVVDGRRISVYTGRIVLTEKIKGKRYLIGYGFEIFIGIGRTPEIKVRNLANTCVNKYHHPFSIDDTDNFCFGAMNDIVKDLLKKRDYLTLIIVALEAINSAEGSDIKDLRLWKEIKE